MTAPVVRRGTPLDRGFVVDLGRRVSSTSVSSQRPGVPALVEGAYERLVEYVLERDHALLIAEVDDEAVGFALVLFDLPDEITLAGQAFVAYMAVEPPARRRGAGRALLAEVESLARKRGLPSVSLMVTDENAPARGLYDSAGYATERRMMTKLL